MKPGRQELALSPSDEEAWRVLRRHIQWGRRFQLLFVFCSNPAVIALFRSRLDALCRGKTLPMQSFLPATAEESAAGFLDAVRAADPIHDVVRAPFWGDFATSVPADSQARAPWLAGLNNMLARLNEGVLCLSPLARLR
jgi:hypothetical protein